MIPAYRYAWNRSKRQGLRDHNRDIDQFLTNASDDEITDALLAAFEMSDGVRKTGEWLDAQMKEGKSNG